MDEVSGWADQAMKRMAEESLSPTPHHFAIWYGYYSGEVPDLIRAINLDIAASKPFTPDRMEELYGKFFSFDREQRAVLQAGMRIQDALGQLLEMLRSSGADTDRYGKALQQFGARLELPGLEQLRSLVDAIASETKLVAQQNQRLQDQLHLSGAQMEELKRNLDSVRQESITDSLTGLFNRRKFDETLQEAASRSVQTGSPLCLLMTDIDHFKKFNDNYGHTIGDHVLALVARTVKECIRSSDTPVRYGGEEFAVILPNVRIFDAVKVAEQIRTAVASKRVVNRSKNITLGTITLSVGVARYVPGEPLGELIKRADAGLYTAKRTGRNRVVAEEAGTPSAWRLSQQRYRAQDGLRFLEAPRLLIAPSRPVGAGLTGRGARSSAALDYWWLLSRHRRRRRRSGDGSPAPRSRRRERRNPCRSGSGSAGPAARLWKPACIPAKSLR